MTNLSSHTISSISITDCVSSTFVKVFDRTILQHNTYAIFGVNRLYWRDCSNTSVIHGELERDCIEYRTSAFVVLSHEDYALWSNESWRECHVCSLANNGTARERRMIIAIGKHFTRSCCRAVSRCRRRNTVVF